MTAASGQIEGRCRKASAKAGGRGACFSPRGAVVRERSCPRCGKPHRSAREMCKRCVYRDKQRHMNAEAPDDDRVYEPDQIEFMKVMDAMKRRLGRPGPGPTQSDQNDWWALVLGEAKRLGYHK